MIRPSLSLVPKRFDLEAGRILFKDDFLDTNLASRYQFVGGTGSYASYSVSSGYLTSETSDWNDRLITWNAIQLNNILIRYKAMIPSAKVLGNPSYVQINIYGVVYNYFRFAYDNPASNFFGTGIVPDDYLNGWFPIKGQWYQIDLVHEQGSQKVFIDGVLMKVINIPCSNTRGRPVLRVIGGGCMKDLEIRSLESTPYILTDPTPVESTGTMWTWGTNGWGQMGQNTSDGNNHNTPTQCAGTWKEIDRNNGEYALGIKSDGTLWGWGYNAYGNLGNNSTAHRSSPVQIGALTTWSKITACTMQKSSYALKTDGTLWRWGHNPYGTGGIPDGVTRSSPVQIGTSTNWIAIAAGRQGAFALDKYSALYGWGYNSGGELGIGSNNGRSSPTLIANQVKWMSMSTDQSSFYIRLDGTLWACGVNDYGQLGLNNITSRYTFAQVGSLTTWSKVRINARTVHALKTDGTLWAWGRNNDGGQFNQGGWVGDNTIVHRSSPVQIGGLTTWTDLSGAQTQNSFYALQSNGTLWMWGTDTYGNLNGQGMRSSPIQLGSVTTYKKIGNGAIIIR
jgi:alpha-tubulin suppressor-like RCC1 family protein